MSDLIVLVPDHCVTFHFGSRYNHSSTMEKTERCLPVFFKTFGVK